MDDDTIHALVLRLSRPHPSGGDVIERAAILAEGGDFSAIVAWIVAHGGEPETAAPAVAGGGLYGARRTNSAVPASRTPLRFVMPAGSLA